ncbi:MAG TPA: hypothetical protein VGG14_16500 [Candidatus Sulfotelmatobacter sp.]|jgi:hypothetical protein
MPKRPAKKEAPETLKGWQQIADFLGEPQSVVQRWANEGMPVHKEGRFVSTTPDELNAWLGKESGKPVHAVTETTDLTAELKRGLSYVWDEQNRNAKTDRVGRKLHKSKIKNAL